MRFILLFILLTSGCLQGGEQGELQVSSVFEQGKVIQVRYTCDGEDISPPLSIDGVSEKAKTIAVIVEDPDAPSGTFIHWVIWNIKADEKTYIPGGIPKEKETSEPIYARQGINDFGRVGYSGPCPPPGKPHRYIFKVYALDSELNLEEGANKKTLERTMKGHILQRGELVGLYSR